MVQSGALEQPTGSTYALPGQVLKKAAKKAGAKKGGAKKGGAKRAAAKQRQVRNTRPFV